MTAPISRMWHFCQVPSERIIYQGFTSGLISGMIETSTKQDVKTMASQKIKDDAQAFFDRVIQLTSKLEVHQACNELKDQFIERKLAVGTISKYLTEYKAPFTKVKKHDNPELLETVTVKGKSTSQHCAYNLLDLTPEQMSELNQQRTTSKHRKSGFDADDNLRDISNIPKTDISEIIEMSRECLKSENPTTIACGIINLTGLRASEQNMPRHEHKEAGIIEHKMTAESDYVIAFRGVVKKRNADDALAFYKRPTLVKAQEIVEAQERYLQSTKVQAISTNIEKYEQTFYQNVKNEYKRRFGKMLSTIESFDNEGNLIVGEENGTPHKGRSFYACALRAVFRLNNFGSAAFTQFIQYSLAHDSETETTKYLASFDESLFINPPTDIKVSRDLKEYGKMATDPIISVKDKTFNRPKFTDGLTRAENVEFVKFLDSGMTETEAVLELFKLVRNTKPATKTAEIVSENVGELTPKTVNQTETSKKSVTEKVNEIIAGIMHYNAQESEGDITKVVVPSHGFINNISLLMYGKTVAPKTVKDCLINADETLDKDLKSLGIDEGTKAIQHNNKYHKSTMAELSAKILEYIEPN